MGWIRPATAWKMNIVLLMRVAEKSVERNHSERREELGALRPDVGVVPSVIPVQKRREESLEEDLEDGRSREKPPHPDRKQELGGPALKSEERMELEVTKGNTQELHHKGILHEDLKQAGRRDSLHWNQDSKYSPVNTAQEDKQDFPVNSEAKEFHLALEPEKMSATEPRQKHLAHVKTDVPTLEAGEHA